MPGIEARGGRIVAVSSIAHNYSEIDERDVDFSTRRKASIVYGNAKRYLGAYFSDTLPENPYIEDPRDVRCVSFSPNGDVLGGNLYRGDIMEILEGYAPSEDN